MCHGRGYSSSEAPCLKLSALKHSTHLLGWAHPAAHFRMLSRFWPGHTTTPNSHSGRNCSLPHSLLFGGLALLSAGELLAIEPNFSQFSSPFAPKLPATAPVLAGLSSMLSPHGYVHLELEPMPCRLHQDLAPPAIPSLYVHLCTTFGSFP